MSKSEYLWKTGRGWKVKSKMTRRLGRWNEEGVPEEDLTYKIEKQAAVRMSSRRKWRWCRCQDR